MSLKNNGRRHGHMTHIVAACALLAAAQAHAAGLSLEAAEAMALRQDPAVQSLQAKRAALDELAVASEQLPDPKLKLGLMNLPTDSWNLDQEAMTQAQIGLSQMFPRGHSRALRAEQIRERSQGVDEMTRDQRLRIVLSVREDFLEVLKQQRRARINAEAIEAFADLADITQDYYATGRVQQQDVLRASVELAKVQDRATRIAQDEERARARLETWVGPVAWEGIAPDWPDLGDVPTVDVIRDRLVEHPRITALQQQIDAAETGIELARQRYKPEFGVDVTYGARSGDNPDGSARSDFLSAMVVMDLPLFHKNRQDRYTAAAVAESSSAQFTRDDMLRRMLSETELHSATLQRQQERIRLFEESLLPDASFNAAAAFDAYQAALETLTTLMRARIIEFDLQLEYASLEAELLKTRARLLYLDGESR